MNIGLTASLYMPVFSVIMNCLNGEKFLKEAIDSIYAQTFTDWEIIFFDSGSSDKSVEIAKNYGDRVKIFTIKTSVPLGQARQEAIDKAKGEFLAFLDVDDIWVPKKLEIQYELMKTGEYEVCYGGVRCIDENNRLLHKVIPMHKSGLLFEQLLRQVEGSWCTYVVNRKKLLQNGAKFNPLLRCSSEEDMILSFLAVDGRGVVVKDILAYYRISLSSVTSNHKNRWALERGATLERLTKENPNIRNIFPEAFNEAEARGYYYVSCYQMDQKNYKIAADAIRTASQLDKKYTIFRIIVAWPWLWNFTHRYKGYLAPLWLKLK